MVIGGFPKIGGTSLGFPRIRTIAYWGLHRGPPILGNYHSDDDDHHHAMLLVVI